MFHSGRQRLRTLADLRAALERLTCGPVHPTGNWTAAQILYHLAAAFEGSVDGLPSGYPKAMRLFVRPFRSVVTRLRFPPRLPIPAAIAGKLAPPADADFREQFDRLLTAIDRFEAADADPPPHPVLGSLTKSEWMGFHLRHCQHHLSFLSEPKEDQT